MGNTSQLDAIEAILKEHTTYFEGKRNFNRRAAFWFTIMPANFSALATVLLGVADKIVGPWPQVVALIATSISTVLGVWHALFANRKLWVANNRTLAAIYELQTDIRYRKADSKPIEQQEIDAYFERSKAINAEAEGFLAKVYSE